MHTTPMLLFSRKLICSLVLTSALFATVPTGASAASKPPTKQQIDRQVLLELYQNTVKLLSDIQKSGSEIRQAKGVFVSKINRNNTCYNRFADLAGPGGDHWTALDIYKGAKWGAIWPSLREAFSRYVSDLYWLTFDASDASPLLNAQVSSYYQYWYTAVGDDYNAYEGYNTEAVCTAMAAWQADGWARPDNKQPELLERMERAGAFFAGWLGGGGHAGVRVRSELSKRVAGAKFGVVPGVTMSTVTALMNDYRNIRFWGLHYIDTDSTYAKLAR